MLAHWLFVVSAELGHLCLLLFLHNRLQALRLTERQKPPLLLALAVAWAAGAVALLTLPRTFSWSSPLYTYAWVCLFAGLVGMPATTLALALRRRPAGLVEERTTQIDFAARIGREPLIGQGAHNWMLRLPGCSSLRLRQADWSVAIPGLPFACDGLSILHLSDLHLGPCYAQRYFEEALEAAACWECDLVLFTGDLIEHEACLGWIEPLLSKVRGRLGSFAVLGNHDYSFDARQIRNALARSGYEDIEGRWTSLELPGATIALGGTAVPWGRGLDLGAAPEADFRILLTHSPDLFPRASASGIELVLAGHNHGGQVRLPVVGAPFVPSLYGRRFDRGFFRRGQTLLHVSEGLGAKHPMRYGTVPEITRLVLQVSRAVAGPTETPTVLQETKGR